MKGGRIRIQLSKLVDSTVRVSSQAVYKESFDRREYAIFNWIEGWRVYEGIFKVCMRFEWMNDDSCLSISYDGMIVSNKIMKIWKNDTWRENTWRENWMIWKE